MKQLRQADGGYLQKYGKQSRNAVFAVEMDTVLPWYRLESLIEQFCPKIKVTVARRCQVTMLLIYLKIVGHQRLNSLRNSPLDKIGLLSNGVDSFAFFMLRASERSLAFY